MSARSYTHYNLVFCVLGGISTKSGIFVVKKLQSQFLECCAWDHYEDIMAWQKKIEINMSLFHQSLLVHLNSYNVIETWNKLFYRYAHYETISTNK